MASVLVVVNVKSGRELSWLLLRFAKILVVYKFVRQVQLLEKKEIRNKKANRLAQHYPETENYLVPGLQETEGH